MSRPIHGGNLAWAAQIAGCSPSLILDFSASINPWGPPESALRAIRDGLSNLKFYPDPNYSRLRGLLAAKHNLSSEWILPGNGSAELLTWSGWDLSEQSLTYLITPAFGDYWRILRTFAAQVQQYPLDWQIEQDGAEFVAIPVPISQITSSTGLLLNNPHNPTGKIFAAEEIIPYLEAGSLVVVDEAFMDFLLPEQQHSVIALVPDYPNLVVLRSLTKFYSLPGLRIGYAIAHPQRLQRWQQWRDPWCVNALAAAATEAIINDQKFQQQTWDWLIGAKKQLYQGLISLPGLQPLASAANFLLVRTDIPGSQLQTQLLQQERILIRDCLSFPELGEGYFRIAVRTPKENQRLLDGFAKILR